MLLLAAAALFTSISLFLAAKSSGSSPFWCDYGGLNMSKTVTLEGKRVEACMEQPSM